MRDKELEALEAKTCSKEATADYICGRLKSAVMPPQPKMETAYPYMPCINAQTSIPDNLPKLQFPNDVITDFKVASLEDIGNRLMSGMNDLILKQMSKMPKNEALDILHKPVQDTILELYNALDNNKTFVSIHDILNRFIELDRLIEELKERNA